MSRKLNALVIKHQEVSSDVMKLWLQEPYLAKTSQPGQFVHVHCGFTNLTLLRRPISVHSVHIEDETITLVYKIIGKGTNYLSQLKTGDKVDLLGPLGTGFPLDASNPLIIGGGLGVAPLRLLTQRFNDKNITPTLILGFGNDTQAHLAELFVNDKANVEVCTMDGSWGHRGNACQLAGRLLPKSTYDAIYACGPIPMLKNLPLPANEDIPIYVSLEEYMACGVGACLGCAIEMQGGGYKNVCKDGPVFDLKEVVLHD